MWKKDSLKPVRKSLKQAIRHLQHAWTLGDNVEPNSYSKGKFQCMLSFSPEMSQNESFLNFMRLVFRSKGLIIKESLSYDHKIVFFEIDASFEAMTRAATSLKLKKPIKNSSIDLKIPFEFTKRDLFLNNENEEQFFTPLEQQRLVLYLIESIHIPVQISSSTSKKEGISAIQPPSYTYSLSTPDLNPLPDISTDLLNQFFGNKAKKFYPGAPLIATCLKYKFIESLHPLHEESTRARLSKVWAQSLKPQPLEEIHQYFGDYISFYFECFQHFWKSFYIPTILGLCLVLYSYFQSNNDKRELAYSLNTIFMIFWGQIVLKLWERKNLKLACSWGVLKSRQVEPARVDFYGKKRKNPITNQVELYYPKWKRYLKFMIIVPILFFAVGVNTFEIYYLLKWSNSLAQDHSIINFLMYGFLTALNGLMSIFYYKLAEKLTKWENYKTETEQENAFVLKIFILEFLNHFSSIFYVAFVIHDYHQLQSSLTTFLISKQVFRDLFSTLFPYLVRRIQAWGHSLKHLNNSDIHILTVIERDRKMEKQQLYMNYVYIAISFAYIILFAAVFPFSPLIAFISGIFIQKLEAFKLCNVYQRQRARIVSSIGIWQDILEWLCWLSVYTNLALICFTTHQPRYIFSSLGFSEDVAASSFARIACFFVLKEIVMFFIKLFEMLISLILQPSTTTKKIIQKEKFEKEKLLLSHIEDRKGQQKEESLKRE